MTISFINPGEIDMTSIEIMGLSAKTCDSPIGRFGTGLKYAIAITLRLGGKIAIWSGDKLYLFETEQLSFRGKKVERVVMSKDGSPFQPLPFTLDYGLDWKPWQAMRELESNCRDEQGQSMVGKMQPKEGATTIWVDCPEIEKAYTNIGNYFLSTKPFTHSEELEIHDWPTSQLSTKIFYRGVYVGDTSEQLRFCYNILQTLPISEDRMLPAYAISYIKRNIGWAALQCEDETYVLAVVTSSSMYLESKPELPTVFDYKYGAFLRVMEYFCNTGRQNLVSLPYLKYYYAYTNKDDLLYIKANLSQRETQMLVEAKEVLSTHFSELPEINIVKALQSDTLGLVSKDKIYIAKRCFNMGLGSLIGTIYEELCHWKYKYEDETRTFQNYLIDEIARLMLELHDTKSAK